MQCFKILIQKCKCICGSLNKWKSNVKSKYIDPLRSNKTIDENIENVVNNDGVDVQDIKNSIEAAVGDAFWGKNQFSYFDLVDLAISGGIVTDVEGDALTRGFGEMLNNIGITKKAAQAVLQYCKKIESPDNCLMQGTTEVIENILYQIDNNGLFDISSRDVLNDYYGINGNDDEDLNNLNNYYSRCELIDKDALNAFRKLLKNQGIIPNIREIFNGADNSNDVTSMAATYSYRNGKEHGIMDSSLYDIMSENNYNDVIELISEANDIINKGGNNFKDQTELKQILKNENKYENLFSDVDLTIRKNFSEKARELGCEEEKGILSISRIGSTKSTNSGGAFYDEDGKISDKATKYITVYKVILPYYTKNENGDMIQDLEKMPFKHNPYYNIIISPTNVNNNLYFIEPLGTEYDKQYDKDDIYVLKKIDNSTVKFINKYLDTEQYENLSDGGKNIIVYNPSQGSNIKVEYGVYYNIYKASYYNTWKKETSGTLNEEDYQKPTGYNKDSDTIKVSDVADFTQEVEYEWLMNKYYVFCAGWSYEKYTGNTPEENFFSVGGSLVEKFDYFKNEKIKKDEEYLEFPSKIINYEYNKNKEVGSFDNLGLLYDVVQMEYITRDKTDAELILEGILIDSNKDGIYDEIDLQGTKCSNKNDQRRCCKNCQNYVNKIVSSLADVSDGFYDTYVPYLARVVGSWFRDTYFIIPKFTDAAINEYAGDIIESAPSDNGKTDEELATKHREFDIYNAINYNNKGEYVEVDEKYLADTGEYWTEYDRKANGDYQLYLLNADGSTSNIKMEDFIENGKLNNGVQAKKDGKEITGYESKEAAEEDGWAFVKKIKVDSLNNNEENARWSNNVYWSAYGFETASRSEGWKRAVKGENSKVDELYSIIYDTEDAAKDDENKKDKNLDSGIYYNKTTNFHVTQNEDAKRGTTNPLVKYLFKYRQYYIYDGSEAKALEIEKDRNKIISGEGGKNNVVLSRDLPYIYGNGLGDNEWKKNIIYLLNNYGRSAQRLVWSEKDYTLTQVNPYDLYTQWLDWQLDMYYMYKYKTSLIEYYNMTEADIKEAKQRIHNLLNGRYQSDESGLLVLKEDPRDPDLIGTVEITKSSLSVFSILENVGTLDAEYAYRDFKELIVELNYFDKEDLSEKIPKVFTWVLPQQVPAGWPVREFDKQNVDYGTMIHSKETYDALDAYIAEQSVETIVNNNQNQEQVEQQVQETQKENNNIVKSVRYTGYTENQMVVSPVTGKILEVGKHKRKNIYSGEMEEVDYIVIEVMNKENYVPGNDKLNLFYDEYRDVCEGYTIMIDGFDVDLSINGGEYVFDKEVENISDSKKIPALYNSTERDKRVEKEQYKQDAPFIVNYQVSNTLPKPEDNYHVNQGEEKGYYIKEGKYIGKTIKGATSVAKVNDTSGEQNINEEKYQGKKLTYTYDDYSGPAGYIRIVIKDTDYGIVNNLEDFFEIPEAYSSSIVDVTISNFERFTMQFENPWLYNYLYGGSDDYTNLVAKYITKDRKYFICMGDHYRGNDDRNYGFGVLHWLNGSYNNVDYYNEVGVDIRDGTHLEEGVSKLEVEKVEKVRAMIAQDKKTEMENLFGKTLWNSLSINKQDVLMDIAYQYGPAGAPLYWFKNNLGAGNSCDNAPVFNEFGARGEARRVLWVEGRYTDGAGNELKN